MNRFERRSFRFGSRFPKPVKVGEEYDVEITEVGSRGDGITRIKNFVVFVSGTKKGDKKRIKIKEVRRRFAIAEVIEVVKEVKEEAKEPEPEGEMKVEE